MKSVELCQQHIAADYDDIEFFDETKINDQGVFSINGERKYGAR